MNDEFSELGSFLIGFILSLLGSIILVFIIWFFFGDRVKNKWYWSGGLLVGMAYLLVIFLRLGLIV